MEGPPDVLRDGVTGCLHEDLGVAARGVLQLERAACRVCAWTRSRRAAVAQFVSCLLDERDRSPLVEPTHAPDAGVARGA